MEKINFGNKMLNLTSMLNGASIIGCNNEHFGRAENVLAPGKGKNMGDGWETRRRREPGNDWIVVRLGAPGVVERIEVDTAHFKGNFPDRCSVQAALNVPDDSGDLLTNNCTWAILLGEQKLGMDQIHSFEGGAINQMGPVTHVRLNIIPDGGISRFRVFGKLA